MAYLGETTDFAPITCGIPRGTIAGPVIFLAMVNSLCQEVLSRAKFVDDLATANVICTRNIITFPMQHDLDTLSTDCGEKGMEINPIKCEALYEIPELRPFVLPDLHISGTPLPVVDEVKL